MVKKLTPDSPVKTTKRTHECGCSFSKTEDLEDSEGKLNPKTVFVYICDLLAIPIMRCQKTDEPI